MFRFLRNLLRAQPEAEAPVLPEPVRRLSEPKRFLLWCLFLKWPNDPQCIGAAEDFVGYFQSRYDALPPPPAGEEDPECLIRQIYAAGLLACGRLEMADVILGTIPRHQPPGANGYGVVAGSTVMSKVLPLPEALRSSGRRHVDRDAVQRWLDENRTRLRWNAAEDRFVLEVVA